jgi:hypothetical protein
MHSEKHGGAGLFHGIMISEHFDRYIRRKSDGV